jgi:hypothetical protein
MPLPLSSITRLGSRRNVLLGAVLLGPVIASASVMQRTGAAYSATTTNPSSAWTSGRVTLTDDDAGAAMFSVSGMVPGGSGSRCLKVKYNGTLAASAIKLYASSAVPSSPPAGALADQMTIKIEMDTNTSPTGQFSDGSSCALSSPTDVVTTRTLRTFINSTNSWATGIAAPSWTPAGNNTDTFRTFRITWALPSNAASTAQNTSQTVNFTWEAQNS